MKVQFSLSAFSETRWYEYAVRFLFGGLVTAIAGMIAKALGPVIGGLFLAFPAIFSASATLIEKHERQKKDRRRAAESVSLDATGSAIGSIGLGAFAWVVWRALPNHPASLVLTGATLVWLAVSILLWELHSRIFGPPRG
jgi:uncharacterized membrane protein (GlpM family)